MRIGLPDTLLPDVGRQASEVPDLSQPTLLRAVVEKALYVLSRHKEAKAQASVHAWPRQHSSRRAKGLLSLTLPDWAQPGQSQSAPLT